MAAFYGTLKGGRGGVTRTGYKSSGIKASVQSWTGSVITRLVDNNGETYVNVEIANGSSSSGESVFFGTIDELRNKLRG